MCEAATTLPLSAAQVRERIARLPRVSLAHLPTPLEELRRLSDRLAGPRIWIKRDDCTGLALGGNKTRHNEFALAQASVAPTRLSGALTCNQITADRLPPPVQSSDSTAI